MERLKNFCEDLFFFFFGDRLKNFCEVFFGEHLRLCPWSLALASSIPVLGLESVCPRKGCPWPWAWLWIFFLCPWPWPRALCPRLHLFKTPTRATTTTASSNHHEQQVRASASTGASFCSNVTPLYSTGRGRPIPYRIETPSNSVGLAACSDRFLHKKTFWVTR